MPALLDFYCFYNQNMCCCALSHLLLIFFSCVIAPRDPVESVSVEVNINKRALPLLRIIIPVLTFPILLCLSLLLRRLLLYGLLVHVCFYCRRCIYLCALTNTYTTAAVTQYTCMGLWASQCTFGVGYVHDVYLRLNPITITPTTPTTTSTTNTMHRSSWARPT